MRIQWMIVLVYLVLLTGPAFLPLPARSATLTDNLTLFAKFVFWGLWWPFVMVSTMLLGRAWCGVFCPEGALSEYASRHGLHKPIPRWLRWDGWPVLAFIATTVYGQLISVYEYPKAALLILGGSTVAAVAVGFVYGRGKRVWCRYLCPASGVFALLAKIAPLHFRVDSEAWGRYPGRTPGVDCAPLIHIRHMKSASACHACGRCSGYRQAVSLALRSPNREILDLKRGEVRRAEALLLAYGLFGIATGAFQWSASPWFVHMKLWAAERLLERDWLALLADNAPWWLLTHSPETSEVFTWLDGLVMLAYIFGFALVTGSVIVIALKLACSSTGCDRLDWRTLSVALVPLAAVHVFIGLSMLTVSQLQGEGVALPWLQPTRTTLLAGGLAWSLCLGVRLIHASASSRTRRASAASWYCLALLAVAGSWYPPLFLW